VKQGQKFVTGRNITLGPLRRICLDLESFLRQVRKDPARHDSTTTVGPSGCPASLPVTGSPAVVIVRPFAGRACIPTSHTGVSGGHPDSVNHLIKVLTVNPLGFGFSLM